MGGVCGGGGSVGVMPVEAAAAEICWGVAAAEPPPRSRAGLPAASLLDWSGGLTAAGAGRGVFSADGPVAASGRSAPGRVPGRAAVTMWPGGLAGLQAAGWWNAPGVEPTHRPGSGGRRRPVRLDGPSGTGAAAERTPEAAAACAVERCQAGAAPC